MKKSTLRVLLSVLVFYVLNGCTKEEIPASLISGNWGVSEVIVVINTTNTPISNETYTQSFKNVKHAFNEDNTYVFTDIDGEKTQGTWAYSADTKELVITYPSIDYEERFEVLTSTSNELILKTPTVDVEKASSDQDLETLFTASILLLDTPAEEIEPKTVAITYKLTK